MKTGNVLTNDNDVSSGKFHNDGVIAKAGGETLTVVKTGSNQPLWYDHHCTMVSTLYADSKLEWCCTGDYPRPTQAAVAR